MSKVTEWLNQRRPLTAPPTPDNPWLGDYDREGYYDPPFWSTTGCERCGALVANQDTHDAWHNQQPTYNLKTGRITIQGE